jgi:hypothetical protein
MHKKYKSPSVYNLIVKTPFVTANSCLNKQSLHSTALDRLHLHHHTRPHDKVASAGESDAKQEGSKV